MSVDKIQSSFRASTIGYYFVPKKKVHLFAIQVQASQSRWTVLRTYSELLLLHASIKKKLVDPVLFLPRIVYSVEKRKHIVGVYLKNLFETRSVLELQVFEDFFEIQCIFRSSFFGDLELIKYLIEHRNVEHLSTDLARGTALHYACAQGHGDVVKYLRAKGINHLSVDQFGNTPLQLFRQCKLFNDQQIDEIFGADWREHQYDAKLAHVPYQYCKCAQDRKFYVLVNPFGGTKSGERMYNEVVRPVLELANIKHTVCQTEHSGHAEELMKALDLQEYDGVICVSGDGVVNECLNGLASRGKIALRTPFAIMPAGSANALAASVGWLDPLESVLKLTKGICRPLDLFRVTQPKHNTVRYSFLATSWGILPDVDFDSEVRRWMGDIRFTFEAVKNLLIRKPYPARLHYQLGKSFEEMNECGSGCKTCQAPKSEPNLDMKEADEERSLLVMDLANPVIKDLVSFCGSSEEEQVVLDEVRTVSQNDSKVLDRKFTTPELWESIENDLLFFVAENITHVASDMKPTPLAHWCDGYIDMLSVTNVGRWTMLGYFTELKAGSHVGKKGINYKKVKELILEPLTEHTCWDLDGERAPNAVTHICVDPASATVMC